MFGRNLSNESAATSHCFAWELSTRNLLNCRVKRFIKTKLKFPLIKNAIKNYAPMCQPKRNVNKLWLSTATSGVPLEVVN